ncbi:MAG: DUF4249 family protein [Bacteroidetes bacterium]|nr:DUF4249 family protein [Bacteroidota bacterium]
MKSVVTLPSYTVLRLLTLLLVLPILTACENDFSPKSDYEERIVVFSVLDRSMSYQVVRLERTFDAESTNPSNPIIPDPVTEATVTVASSRKNFAFYDTLFTLSDGSKKKVWINRELVPTEGTDYTLTVEVPGYKRITAVTQVPSRAYVQMQVVNGGVRVAAVENTAYPASGYYFRMWVVGTKTVDGVDVDVRREVPSRFNAITGEYEFSEPSRDKSVTFSNGNMLRVHTALREDDGVTGRDVVGVAYSFDQYLYSYYKLARGFDDPVSVRQDRPDISNIQNGVGIFGALFADSVRVRFSSVVQQ